MSLNNSAAEATTFQRINPALIFSAVLFISGGLLIFWSCFDARFRNSENDFTGLVCLPVSAGIALLINVLTVRTEWRKAGFWFGLALVGKAVSLQMINAGAGLRYQHYKSVGQIFGELSPVIWGFLIFQTILVFFGIVFLRKRLWNWVKPNFKIWQALLVAAFFLIPTATVSENISFYIQEWLFAGFVQTINLGSLVLFAFSIPREATGNLQGLNERLFGETTEKIEPGMPDRFALRLAVLVVIAAALLNIFSYERHPHVPDEVSYLTHARFFASGVLTMPAPLVPEAFEVYLMTYKGAEWFPAPPPGWSMILAVGTIFGVPWLVNPLLAGLNLLLSYILLRELYPKRTARIAVFLLAFSPWYLFLGMSFMTHIFALTCALLAAVGVAWARRTENSLWAWAGGLALGMIVLVRPLEAVAMAGLLGLWSIGLGGKRLKISGIAGLVLGSMIVGGLGLLYNAALTGKALEFPINAYTNAHFGPNSNAYGFGPDRGMGWAIDPNPGHSPTDALINSNLNISTLNTELFGWSIGGFLLLGIFFCLAKFQRSDHLMLAVIGVIYILHFFYYFSGGPDFSARYWFLMIVPLVALTARGIQLLAAKLKETSADADVRLFAVVIALCLLTLINFIPWRAVDKYHNFRGMRSDVRYLAAKHNFGRSLVLVQGNQHPEYDSAFVYNPLDLRADAPVYAWDRDAETREKLLRAYADRPVWIIKSPSLTGRGFEVSEGPLSTRDLLLPNDR